MYCDFPFSLVVFRSSDDDDTPQLQTTPFFKRERVMCMKQTKIMKISKCWKYFDGTLNRKEASSKESWKLNGSNHWEESSPFVFTHKFILRIRSIELEVAAASARQKCDNTSCGWKIWRQKNSFNFRCLDVPVYICSHIWVSNSAIHLFLNRHITIELVPI